jgi:hypothetical protein
MTQRNLLPQSPLLQALQLHSLHHECEMAALEQRRFADRVPSNILEKIFETFVR